VRGSSVHHPPRRAHRSITTRRGLRHASAIVTHRWRSRGRYHHQ
jgi:hypothetical protein